MPIGCAGPHTVGDGDFSAGVSVSEVVDGFGGLAQWVGPVDDRCDLAGFQELVRASRSSWFRDKRTERIRRGLTRDNSGAWTRMTPVPAIHRL